MAAITVAELVKEVGIAEEDLDVKCSQEHLLVVSSFLDWRLAAPYLGLSKTEISDIAMDGRKEQEKRRIALEMWSGKYGFKATYRKLVDALLASGQADDAEKVCRLLIEAIEVLEQDTKKADQEAMAEQLSALQMEKKDLLAALDHREAQLCYESKEKEDLEQRVKQLQQRIEGQEKEKKEKERSQVELKQQLRHLAHPTPPTLPTSLQRAQHHTSHPLDRFRGVVVLQGYETISGKECPYRMSSTKSTGFASAGWAVGATIGMTVGAIVREVFSGKDYSYRLLLIGEIGSGKTSFLNLLCNFGLIQALGCKFDEDGLARFKEFNDIKLENAQSHQMESKTSNAKLYEANLGELKVGIIDTPGFGDSRGMDKKIMRLIIDTLRDEEYVNCVCLIINGRQSHMSATLQYVLSEVTAILPREVLNNVIVVFTNTSDPLDLNFDPNTLERFFGQRIRSECIFYIENPYCRFEKAKKKQGQLPMEMIARSLKRSFEETAEVLGKMCTVMKDFEMVHTHRFVELYEKKQEIEKGVLTLLTAYDNQRQMEKMIAKAQEEADAALQTKTLNTNFRSTQRIMRTNVVSTPRHNTLCGVPGCYSNCHVPCNLDKSFDKETFRSCRCIGDDDRCSKCGHHYTYHYHNEVRFEEVQEVKEFVDPDMKRKFEEAEIQEERARIFKEGLEVQRKQSESERKRLSEELLLLIKEFHKLGINRNYAKLLENQLAAINLRLEGTAGPESQHLRKIKDELEKKLQLVQATLKASAN